MAGKQKGPDRGSEVKAAERRLEAVRLRAEGLSYRQIGERLQVSYTQAHNDVRAGLKSLHGKLGERMEEYVRLELERLEMPLSVLAKQVLGGDLDALEQWRKLSESRRKLLGLDAAEKHIVTLDVDREIDQLLAQLAGTREGEAPEAPARAGGDAAGGRAEPPVDEAAAGPEPDPGGRGPDPGPLAEGPPPLFG